MELKLKLAILGFDLFQAVIALGHLPHQCGDLHLQVQNARSRLCTAATICRAAGVRRLLSLATGRCPVAA
jgi:hypothetical protein